MRAAIFRDGDLVLDRIAEPEPGRGQVLVKTLACGICASDIHAFHHAADMVATAKRNGSNFVMDLTRDIVFGHEFCAEVVDYGPDTERRLKPGTVVTSVPLAFQLSGHRASAEPLGFSNTLPGGYGETMVLSERLLAEVPNGLSPVHAALTEPMAVGWHALMRARMEGDEVPLVIGCGPVGLAVIAALRIRGIRPIVAADFSPTRRSLAETMGADIVVDPARESPYDRWHAMATPEGYDPTDFTTMLGLGAKLRPAVIFECVGAPGIVQQIIEGAPKEARIVVVGICMTKDVYEPFGAIDKQLNLQFVIGNTPDEFRQSLNHIAEGLIDVEPLLTGTVGVDGIRPAFDALADPERHVKIVIEPWR